MGCFESNNKFQWKTSPKRGFIFDADNAHIKIKMESVASDDRSGADGAEKPEHTLSM